jgi:hypothetical protein
VAHQLFSLAVSDLPDLTSQFEQNNEIARSLLDGLLLDRGNSAMLKARKLCKFFRALLEDHRFVLGGCPF